MSEKREHLHLPDYQEFSASIDILLLRISTSLLHGMMCGYLCAGADIQGEAYLRALLNNKKDDASRNAILAIFAVFSISQQQINSMDFEFQMLLPTVDESLKVRAQAFSQWCDGFIQALTLAGIGANQFQDEETQDAFQHIIEFADLDCDTLDIDEDDERALMEVSEYARMAVLRLHGDLMQKKEGGAYSGITH
jgi:yecA family protein